MYTERLEGQPLVLLAYERSTEIRAEKETPASRIGHLAVGERKRRGKGLGYIACSEVGQRWPVDLVEGKFAEAEGYRRPWRLDSHTVVGTVP